MQLPWEVLPHCFPSAAATNDDLDDHTLSVGLEPAS